MALKKEVAKVLRQFDTSLPDTMILGDLQRPEGIMVKKSEITFGDVRDRVTKTTVGLDKLIPVLLLKDLDMKDIHNPEVILKLAETTINDEDVEVRALSAGVFLHLGDVSHVPKLLDCFDENSHNVFGKAAMALRTIASFSDSETRRTIVSRMLKGLSSEIHSKDKLTQNELANIIDGISQKEKDSLADLYIDELKNPNTSEQARGTLFFILGIRGMTASPSVTQRIIETLKEYVEGPDEGERNSAKRALREIDRAQA